MTIEYNFNKAIVDQKVNRNVLVFQYKEILHDAIAKINKIKDRTYAAEGAREKIKIELTKLIENV